MFTNVCLDILKSYNVSVTIYLKLCLGIFQWAICKPRHWNLGIGIGTDTTNAIISSSIRPIYTKIRRVVIKDDGAPPR